MAKKTPTMEAQVTALLVAQDVFRDDRTRTHVIGIFDSIGVDTFPLSFSFVVFCAVRGAGTHIVFVRVVDPQENRLAESEPVAMEVNPTGNYLFLRFAINLKAPGMYKVLAFLDGMRKIENPLFVRLGQSSIA